MFMDKNMGPSAILAPPFCLFKGPSLCGHSNYLLCVAWPVVFELYLEAAHMQT